MGQQVEAYDPATGKTKAQTITRVYLNHDSDRLDVTLATQQPAAQEAQASEAHASSNAHQRQAPRQRNEQAAEAQQTTDGVHTTANHPWLSADRGWVVAGSLRVGEPVRLLDGATARVVELRDVPGMGAMWDLSLDATHTFAVGDVQAVVHNCPDGSAAPPVAASGANSSGTVDLYRAVGVREYKSVMGTGGFAPGGNSLEARQFALSASDAYAYARTDTSKVAILKATIWADALPSFDFSQSIDPHVFTQGVVTVQPGEQSEIFHQALISITEVP